MANGKTTKEQVAYLRAENKSQTQQIKSVDKKLDLVIKKLDDHEKSSETYRVQQAKNTTKIEEVEKTKIPFIWKAIIGIYSLFGASLLVVIGAFVKEYIKKLFQ